MELLEDPGAVYNKLQENNLYNKSFKLAKMIVNTIYGAGKLMESSEDDPETLRNKVACNGGVTYEALTVFKQHNLDNIVKEAMDNAYKKAVELSQ